MKRNSSFLHLTAATVMISITFACTKSTSLSPESNDRGKTTFKVAQMSPNSQPMFSTSKEALSENIMKRVSGVHNIRDHSIEQFGNTYYLTAKATDLNNTNVSIAVELAYNEYGNSYNLVGTGNTHTCTSQAGCSGCEFVRGTDPHNSGQIIGCRCTIQTSSDGKCQHSVTTVEK